MSSGSCWSGRAPHPPKKPRRPKWRRARRQRRLARGTGGQPPPNRTSHSRDRALSGLWALTSTFLLSSFSSPQNREPAVSRGRLHSWPPGWRRRRRQSAAGCTVGRLAAQLTRPPAQLAAAATGLRFALRCVLRSELFSASAPDSDHRPRTRTISHAKPTRAAEEAFVLRRRSRLPSDEGTEEGSRIRHLDS